MVKIDTNVVKSACLDDRRLFTIGNIKFSACVLINAHCHSLTSGYRLIQAQKTVAVIRPRANGPAAVVNVNAHSTSC